MGSLKHTSRHALTHTFTYNNRLLTRWLARVGAGWWVSAGGNYLMTRHRRWWRQGVTPPAGRKGRGGVVVGCGPVKHHFHAVQHPGTCSRSPGPGYDDNSSSNSIKCMESYRAGDHHFLAHNFSEHPGVYAKIFMCHRTKRSCTLAPYTAVDSQHNMKMYL